MTTTLTLADLKARMAADTLWLRAEFFRLVPCVTAEEIAVLITESGEDRRESAAQWETEGRLFHVNRGSTVLYPAFQLGTDLEPLPIVGEILGILRQVPSRSDWDNAMWFVGGNGWLDGASPLGTLFAEPALVKHAAVQEVLPDIE